MWKYVYVLLLVGEVHQAISLLLRVGVDDVRAVLQTIAEHTVNVDLRLPLCELFQVTPVRTSCARSTTPRRLLSRYLSSA